MAGESGSLAASVRRKLDQGQPAEDVIQELVAGGLSRATAERFVDRAFAESPAPQPWTPPEPVASLQPSNDYPPWLTDYVHDPEAIAESQAYKDLMRGAIVMTIGSALMLPAFVFPVLAWLMYGLVACGLLVFGRGVVRCRRLARRFPWRRVLASATIPGVVSAVFGGSIGWIVVAREREARAVAAAELAAADASRSDQIREESKTQREAANQARTERQDARLAEALTQLSSDHPMTQCDAALLLGRSGSKEHVPPLVDLLSTGTGSIRSCAAGALVQLGETDTALAAYAEWAEDPGTDLYRSALGGFGDIGPSAAGVALPYLAEALKSPHKDLRYLAVDSLAKLGPAGVPLLQVATGDADTLVREGAARALAGKP